MFDNIYNLYKDKIILNMKTFDSKLYYYFYNENDNIFGIRKDITTEAYQLLKSIYVEKTFYQNDLETTNMLEYLFQDKDYVYEHYKFLIMHSSIIIDDKTYSKINDLIKDIFEDVIIFKKDDLIICFLKNDISDIIGIIENINSDFYVSLKVYESFYINYKDKDIFNLVYSNFKDILKLDNNKYHFNVTDLVRYLIKRDDLNNLKLIKNIINNILSKQEDLNEVIKAFFESNLNISMGANLAYMHRNTFNKKVELFIEITGINIKNFEDAFIYKYLLMI